MLAQECQAVTTIDDAWVHAARGGWSIYMPLFSSLIWMVSMAWSGSLDVTQWGVVNDSVMGGVSTSQVVEAAPGEVQFRGNLSLENNGGFTSARYRVDADWSRYRALRTKIRGDGRTYLFTVRVRDSRMRRIYYRVPVETEKNKVMDIEIPFSDFQAYAYGMRVPQAPVLLTQTGRISTVGVMLADKNPGSFTLDILEMEPVPGDDSVVSMPMGEATVTAVLQQAIQEGVPLFNRGEPERCYDIYRTALTGILMLASDQISPDQRSLIQRALRQAQGMSSPNDQAWALRTAMDAIMRSAT